MGGNGGICRPAAGECRLPARGSPPRLCRAEGISGWTAPVPLRGYVSIGSSLPGCRSVRGPPCTPRSGGRRRPPGRGLIQSSGPYRHHPRRVRCVRVYLWHPCRYTLLPRLPAHVFAVRLVSGGFGVSCIISSARNAPFPSGVYRAIRSVHFLMRSVASSQRHRLRHHPVPDKPVQGYGLGNIDGDPEQCLQLRFQGNGVEEASIRFEVDQKVKVAPHAPRSRRCGRCVRRGVRRYRRSDLARP